MNTHPLTEALLSYFRPSCADPNEPMPHMQQALSDESGHGFPTTVHHWLSPAGDAWLFLGYQDGHYAIFGTDLGTDTKASISKGLLGTATLRVEGEEGGFMLGGCERAWLVGCIAASNTKQASEIIQLLLKDNTTATLAALKRAQGSDDDSSN